MGVVAYIVFWAPKIGVILFNCLKAPDFKKLFIVKPNAFEVAVGAGLLQQYNDGLYSMAYFNKKYIHAEGNYAPRNKELLAIFEACQK